MSEIGEIFSDMKLITRETNQDRVRKFVASFEPASKLAREHGMRLTNPSEGCYQLRRFDPDWIYNLYPKPNSDNPRVWIDPNRRGPFLTLPEQWDLLDAVKSVLFVLGEVVDK